MSTKSVKTKQTPFKTFGKYINTNALTYTHNLYKTTGNKDIKCFLK